MDTSAPACAYDATSVTTPPDPNRSRYTVEPPGIATADGAPPNPAAHPLGNTAAAAYVAGYSFAPTPVLIVSRPTGEETLPMTRRPTMVTTRPMRVNLSVFVESVIVPLVPHVMVAVRSFSA